MVKKKVTKKKSTKATQKRSKATSLLSYIAWGLALIALILGSLLVGYYIGYDDAQESFTKDAKASEAKRLALLNKLEKTVVIKEKNVNKRLKEVLKKELPVEKKEYVSASHEFDGAPLAKEPKPIQREKRIVSTKPRIAIIIDDVGTSSQVRALKSLKIPLTMSFLPPSRARPNTPKLAAKESIYMVHLPMEAQNWSAEEPFTLRVNDSQAHIFERINEIKQLFPKVKYINNHTGSKFTSNERAMNRLITALKKNNIYFIDSRTTAQTKAPKVMKNFGYKYMARDIFLDHHMDKKYVLGQIKKAIKIAKTHGTAIAIGHPHKNTLKALYESKELLKEVELVYINRLY
jgi:polysaccharide deacetylase 2 family uncharacterized protein YibQ